MMENVKPTSKSASITGIGIEICLLEMQDGVRVHCKLRYISCGIVLDVAQEPENRVQRRGTMFRQPAGPGAEVASIAAGDLTGPTAPARSGRLTDFFFAHETKHTKNPDSVRCMQTESKTNGGQKPLATGKHRTAHGVLGEALALLHTAALQDG
ncbi:hypothetical protein VTK26DRAFT_177 [Humicola hyalothermophila]